MNVSSDWGLVFFCREIFLLIITHTHTHTMNKAKTLYYNKNSHFRGKIDQRQLYRLYNTPRLVD